jgi:uncharacterized protein (TIGR00251 family)
MSELGSRLPWRSEAGGLLLTVRLTPKGGRDAIEGIEQLASGECVLKVRVRAPPHEGQANAALVKVLAKALGVPSRDVRLVSGLGARMKRARIAGSSAALAARLAEICGGSAAR